MTSNDFVNNAGVIGMTVLNFIFPPSTVHYILFSVNSANELLDHIFSNTMVIGTIILTVINIYKATKTWSGWKIFKKKKK